ncbi:UDP-N-acetylmuramoyl-tripeptide--D-alanyl-D-alanine ligase [uncultured Gammaproteobacteria bacterium]
MTTDHSSSPLPPLVLWSAEEAAQATEGQAFGGWSVSGLSIDSRSLAPGDLFVALQGPNFDGHDFAAAALVAGAGALCLARPVAGLPADAPRLMVQDTLTGLQDLARVARLRGKAKVIAVTGSVGKTGVKEALRHCLDEQAPTHASVGSLNNHWGVPLSLARLPAEAEFAVFELGMNHVGEIGPLSRLVKPDVAVVTTIEPAHMEFFATVEAIADAKAEIFEGMAPDGTAVLNRDNPYFARLLAAARTRGVARVWSFGGDPAADARLIGLVGDADGSVVSAELFGQRLEYRLSLAGRHQALNSLAVLLAAAAAGADTVAAARQMARLTPVKGRGTRRAVALARGGTLTLIDESYNASPVAMAAACAVLGAVMPGAGGRRVAVLGDMRELGERADEYHAALVEPLQVAGVERVYCCGPHMAALFERLPETMRGGYTLDSKTLTPLVVAGGRAGDVVLVKGSAGSRMAVVVEALVALDGGVAAMGAATGPTTTIRAAAVAGPAT